MKSRRDRVVFQALSRAAPHNKVAVPVADLGDQERGRVRPSRPSSAQRLHVSNPRHRDALDGVSPADYRLAATFGFVPPISTDPSLNSARMCSSPPSALM